VTKKFSTVTAIGACVAFSQLAIVPPAFSAALKLEVDSIKNGEMIPAKFTFCMPAAEGHAGASSNISPTFKWSKGPEGTQSYVVILNDTDSPKENRDKMNKEGMTVPSTSARQTFFHLVLVDIPPTVLSLPEGTASDARVLHGKPATQVKVGVPGLNDFTRVFAANDAMKGKYYGWDGPCPPWNDEVLHHYHFMVYALSVKSLNLGAEFDGPAAMDAMKGKILAEGKLDTVYSTNPATGAVIPKK
jgi:Raf kinase inhibitor-like YbhB/YbcL family protein